MKAETKEMLKWGASYSFLCPLFATVVPLALFSRPMWSAVAWATPGGFLLGCAYFIFGHHKARPTCS
jgi:hypothetical protein